MRSDRCFSCVKLSALDHDCASLACRELRSGWISSCTWSIRKNAPHAGATLQVYLDDGAQISAGTVAARWRGEFLIGALLDKKVLICKPNP
jgi:hypothetical protein